MQDVEMPAESDSTGVKGGVPALTALIFAGMGAGTFTFLGGHDPEDPQHAIGDPPTDLEYHPRSPGYRLILNNVLFPAARQEERKT